jgi:hypothetical protein
MILGGSLTSPRPLPVNETRLPFSAQRVPRALLIDLVAARMRQS